MKSQMVALVLLGAAVWPQAQAEEGGEWVIGPAFEDGWSPDFTLALTANYFDPDASGLDSDSGFGLQLSLNCPWFQPPSGLIRQQFNYNKFDDKGIDVTTFELNPRYYVDMSASSRIGVGPGFGYMWTDTNGAGDSDMWTFQLGGDYELRAGPWFLGLGARYQWTQDKTVGPSDSGLDNWLVQLKAGINL